MLTPGKDQRKVGHGASPSFKAGSLSDDYIRAALQNLATATTLTVSMGRVLSYTGNPSPITHINGVVVFLPTHMIMVDGLV